MLTKIYNSFMGVFLMLLRSHICNICYEPKIYFSVCPYHDNHKWCEDCNREINKCPYCRESFKKILICLPNFSEFLLEPICVNKKLKEDE